MVKLWPRKFVKLEKILVCCEALCWTAILNLMKMSSRWDKLLLWRIKSLKSRREYCRWRQHFWRNADLHIYYLFSELGDPQTFLHCALHKNLSLKAWTNQLTQALHPCHKSNETIDYFWSKCFEEIITIGHRDLTPCDSFGVTWKRSSTPKT